MTQLVAILGLAFLILIHEAGHFFVALAVKMRPRKFYVFFPPALVKRVRNGIEYGIGAIPLGGYVKIPGMHRPAPRDLEAHMSRAVEEAPWLARDVEPVRQALAEERLDDARGSLPELRGAVERAPLSEAARKGAERALTDVEDALSPEAYWRAPAWKRIAVIFAGPATNLVFAIALLALVYMLGVPVDVTRTIESVNAGTPAARAGLQPGDRLVGVDGKRISPRELSDAINESRGRSLELTVLRAGEETTVRARPVRDGERYRLGITFEARYRSFGAVTSVRLAAEDTWRLTSLTGAAVGRLVTGSGRDEIASPYGIVQGSSEALDDYGFRVYLRILAFISLSLALLNLLPLLPLDGGHIAFSVIEKLRGRAIPREAYERVSAVGIALVLMLFFIGLSNDISRPGGG